MKFLARSRVIFEDLGRFELLALEVSVHQHPVNKLGHSVGVEEAEGPAEEGRKADPKDRPDVTCHHKGQANQGVHHSLSEEQVQADSHHQTNNNAQDVNRNRR